MEVVAEFQGIDAEKDIWQYFCRHWLSMLPQLKSRSSFVRQAANLWQYKQQLAQAIGAFADHVHLVFDNLMTELSRTWREFINRY